MTDVLVGMGLDPGLAKTGIAGVLRHPNGSYESRGVRVSVTETEKNKAFTRMRTSADDQRRIHAHWQQIVDSIQVLKPSVIGIENYTVFTPRGVEELRKVAEEVAGPESSLSRSTDALLGILDKDARARSDPDHIQALLTWSLRTYRELGRALALPSTGIGLGQAARTLAVYGAALGAAYTANVPVFVFQPADVKKRFTKKKSASKEDVGQAAEQVIQGLSEAMAQRVPQKTLKEHAWDASCHAVLALEEYQRFRLDARGRAG